MGATKRTPDEIEMLIRTHSDMVYGILRLRFPRQPETVDDLYQTVFLKLVENEEKLQSEDHVKYWLIRVTLNTGRSFLSNGYNRRVKPFSRGEDGEDQSDCFGDILPTDTSAPEAETLRKERIRETYAAVCSLQEPYRVIIHLSYYGRYSSREIAEILSISEGAARTRLSRALDALEKKLKERGYYDQR